MSWLPLLGSGADQDVPQALLRGLLDRLHVLPANQVLADSGQKAGNCAVEGGPSAAPPASGCHGNSWSAMWPQRRRDDPCLQVQGVHAPCFTEQSNSYCAVSSFSFGCHSAARSIECTVSLAGVQVCEVVPQAELLVKALHRLTLSAPSAAITVLIVTGGSGRWRLGMAAVGSFLKI